MEFQCGYCDKVKGRDEFMKAQLKNNADSPVYSEAVTYKFGSLTMTDMQGLRTEEDGHGS